MQKRSSMNRPQPGKYFSYYPQPSPEGLPKSMNSSSVTNHQYFYVTGDNFIVGNSSAMPPISHRMTEGCLTGVEFPCAPSPVPLMHVPCDSDRVRPNKAGKVFSTDFMSVRKKDPKQLNPNAPDWVASRSRPSDNPLLVEAVNRIAEDASKKSVVASKNSSPVEIRAPRSDQIVLEEWWLKVQNKEEKILPKWMKFIPTETLEEELDRRRREERLHKVLINKFGEGDPVDQGLRVLLNMPMFNTTIEPIGSVSDWWEYVSESVPSFINEDNPLDLVELFCDGYVRDNNKRKLPAATESSLGLFKHAGSESFLRSICRPEFEAIQNEKVG